MPDQAMSRIVAANAGLNAFIRPENLAQMAQVAPAPGGPMSGMLVGIKDNIALQGQPWTAGMGARQDIIAENDAHVVKRLRAAGAIVLGGLNMDEAALGATTDNPHFGRTLNPLDPQRSPGGSSGGSAAAVAADLVDLALGSDTMGSVRIPAAYCGIWGFKPSRGLVGRSGVYPLAPSLDSVGFLARTPDGLLQMLGALEGPDPEDPDSRILRPVALPDMAGLRVGIPRLVAQAGCDPVMMQGLAMAQQALLRAGAQVLEITADGWNAAALEAATFLWTEAEAALAITGKDGDPPRVSVDLGKMLDYGRRVSAAKLVAAQAVRNDACAAVDRMLAQVDLILTPTTPRPAFVFGSAAPTHQAIFTVLANVAGLPALAMPVPVANAALPGSVQLIGPAGSDAHLIAAAAVMALQLQEEAKNPA